MVEHSFGIPKEITKTIHNHCLRVSLERSHGPNFEGELCQATSERSSLMELDEVSLPKVTCDNFGWGLIPLSTRSTSTFLAQRNSALARVKAL